MGCETRLMSSRGQSLSMFVVQRTFSRVRRGYDPDEVDRHLELVSQWFTSTDIGRAFTHERAGLHQASERWPPERPSRRADRGSAAGGRGDARGRPTPRRRGGRAADRTLAEARQEAAAIRADAERHRTEILDQARAEAAAAEVIRVAEEQAATIVERASEDAERILAEARSAAERELTAARRDREQRLAEVRAEVAKLAERLRKEADAELRIYTDSRRREADRLAQAARREQQNPAVVAPAAPPTAQARRIARPSGRRSERPRRSAARAHSAAAARSLEFPRFRGQGWVRRFAVVLVDDGG